MYEEHGNAQLLDDTGPTKVMDVSPSKLADLLHSKISDEHVYWTRPISEVAPKLLERLSGYETIGPRPTRPRRFLDPRGPSLWMGTSGSGTQAHYDVADNVLVQLFGTKRVRCFRPEAFRALHVFPDAHPRARKAQVNIDQPDHLRFPNFEHAQKPFLDVVLRPGEALEIPAFWFHHVENGSVPGLHTNQFTVDGPAVSLNIFALSEPMMTAQRIFQDASRPFGLLPSPGPHDAAFWLHFQFSVVALRALVFMLLTNLDCLQQDSPNDFIRKNILDTRYAPLRNKTTTPIFQQKQETSRNLTVIEREDVARCIQRVIPHFHSLRTSDDDMGISKLVACHLLELWAVELLGPQQVEVAYEAVLLLKD